MTTTVVTSDQSHDVYIGPGSPWGNPFKNSPHTTVQQLQTAYRAWFSYQTDLIKRLPELRGKVLGQNLEDQHGTVLVELIDRDPIPDPKDDQIGRPQQIRLIMLINEYTAAPQDRALRLFVTRFVLSRLGVDRWGHEPLTSFNDLRVRDWETIRESACPFWHNGDWRVSKTFEDLINQVIEMY